MLWVVFSGVDGFSHQNGDWIKHNSVLQDLINYKWPVVYSANQGTGRLIYYIAYYLPSAVVGKIFGISIANIALFVWTVIGLLLGAQWVMKIIKSEH